MTDPHRPLAVVTGAANGIGLALAHELARHGFELLLTAEGGDVPRIAGELGAEWVPDVGALPEAIGARPVTVLALSACVAEHARELDVVDLNCRSLVHAARLLTADMAAAGRGRVLVAAPVAGLYPGSHAATYAASTAFARSFGASLRGELRCHGVSVTVLEPPPGAASPGDPEAIASAAFEALMAGRETAYAGAGAARPGVARLLPDRLGALAIRAAVPRSSRG